MGNGETYSIMRHLTLLLIAAAIAVIVVIAYHFISVCWYNRGQRRWRRPSVLVRQEEAPSSMEHSMVQLIPAHKYQKGSGLVGEDNTCAICLSEFEEGEELRTLLECVHSFHVPCIDMWLYSHSTCPICRTDSAPLPAVLGGVLDSELDGSITQPIQIVAPNFGLHLGVS